MPARRQVLGWLGAAACAPGLAAGQAQRPAKLADWSAWQAAFVQDGGRVVDDGQQGISTSESQGYGMLLAASVGDQARFDALWQWTQQQLAKRSDSLLCWRWTPGQGISDPNNASDGDLIVAWALARAGQRFAQTRYTAAAQHLAQAIRSQLLVDTPWGLVLMPAVRGFAPADGRRINLSYWVFPALAELAAVDPSPQWAALTASGLKLLRIARFGRWGLPADWLQLVDPLRPAPERPPRYGYEAVRIPLYLHWARLGTPALLAPFEQFWRSFPCQDFLPAWTNLLDDSIDSYGAPAGLQAIRRCVLNTSASGKPAPLPAQGYYSATLGLLAALASQEGATP